MAEGQCGTAGSEGKVLLWATLMVTTGCTSLWARGQVTELAHEAMCPWKPWVGFLQVPYFLRTLSGGQIPVPEPRSQQAKKQGRPDKVSFLPSCLPEPL